MTRLLIYTPDTDGGDAVFAGLPVADGAPFAWPVCRSCGGAMQYLGRVIESEHAYQVFMCQNEPGVCGEWEADGGANAVVVTPASAMHPVQPPPEGETLRSGPVYGGRSVLADGEDYHTAIQTWADAAGATPRHVLGQTGDAPDWIQGDETPTCAECSQPMRFVAQLEEGPDYATAMNFGGGCAYLFACDCGPHGAFLWQC